MEGVSDSAPSAPMDSAPVDSAPVDSGAPASAPDSGTGTAGAETAAPQSTNPDVQATTEGKSDYQAPEAKAGTEKTEAQKTEDQKTEAQKTEAQKVQDQKTEAQKTEAQKTEAQKVTNPDVQATTEGKSDYRPPETKAPVDLKGGQTRNLLPTVSSPNGVTASSTVTNTLDQRESKDLPGLTGKTTNATTVSANTSQSASAGENGPTAVNKNSVTVSNTTTGTVTASNGTVSVNASVNGGASTKVETSVPVGAQGGTDPRDPDKMAVGAKVTLTPSVSAGRGEGAEVKAGPLTVGASESRTATGSSVTSVEKVDDNTMRVSTGPRGAVSTESALKASVGAGPASAGATLSADRGRSQTDQTTRDFDMRNPAAREAYQKYVAGGPLPDADPAKGITGSSSSTFSTTHDNKAAIDAKLGPLAGKVSIPLSNADGTVKITNNADGTTTLGHSLTMNNQNMTLSRTYGADGVEDPSKRKYDFVFSNANGSTAGNLAMGASNNARFADAVQRRGNQDVQMSFTQADMDKLRLQAGAHPYSQDQNSFIGRLSRADDPGKVLNTFTDSRRGAVEQLGQLANRTGQPIPGQAHFLDRNTGQTWRHDQPVTRANGRALW